MEDPLYSFSVKNRLVATKAFEANPKPICCPAGLRGAANAMLILLGPSFGKPHSESSLASNETASRPMGGYLTIGQGLYGPGRKLFDYDGGRFTRWDDFLVKCCGSHDIPYYLSALFNLDWSYSANEGDIKSIDLKLEPGAKIVLPYVVNARPRVVAALTNRVYDAFRKCI